MELNLSANSNNGRGMSCSCGKCHCELCGNQMEQNKLRAEIARLKLEVEALEASNNYYADDKNICDEGRYGQHVERIGTFNKLPYMDWEDDGGDCARAAKQRVEEIRGSK